MAIFSIQVNLDREELDELLSNIICRELRKYFKELDQLNKPVVLSKYKVRELLRISSRKLTKLIASGDFKTIDGKITTESFEQYIRNFDMYPEQEVIKMTESLFPKQKTDHE